jgi:hypothetical protein
MDEEESSASKSQFVQRWLRIVGQRKSDGQATLAHKADVQSALQQDALNKPPLTVSISNPPT